MSAAANGAFSSTPFGTWDINPTVRRVLARTILDLRKTVEDDFRKQLASIGVHPGGFTSPGRPRDTSEHRAREVAVAVVGRDVQAGVSHADAVEAFVRESAFTLLNRMVGLRCLDERGLLVVDGQAETAIKLDPTRNASSLYWHVRNALPPTTNPREVWRETLLRAETAISERIRVLFDPKAEHAVVLPLLPTLQRVVGALNSPEIPASIWAEDEVLGWVYQYYQSAEKDAAYARLANGKKLERPEELAAATCLYTERYMVDYLLQNTLGALWMEMYPESRLAERWPYYVRSCGDGPPFRREPRPVRSLTLIDPACGSGHFLVRAFDLLTELYREEGRETEDEIPHLILERNLYGIDIDVRAIQIAALALYLKASSLGGPAFRPRLLNLVPADIVLPGNEPAAEYLARFKDDADAVGLVKGIWQGLRNVRQFGSLLQPERVVAEVVRKRRERERGQLWEQDDAAWERWKTDLLNGLYEDFDRQGHSQDLGQRLFGEEAAKGISLVQALGRDYDVVVMNPPYAGSKNLNERFRKFVEREFPNGKRDLYAAFIQRCREFALRDGFVGMVTQQSWLFLRSFADLRRQVLKETSIETLVHLGSRSFEEIGGEVVNTALFTLRNGIPRLQHRPAAFRLVGGRSPSEKERLLRAGVAEASHPLAFRPRQSDFLTIPDSPFVYWLRPRFFELLTSSSSVGDIADVRVGLQTSDDERFTRCFWEVAEFGLLDGGDPVHGRWFWFAKGGRYQKWAGLQWLVVDWEHHGARIKNFFDANGRLASRPQNESYYFRRGLTYTPMAGGNLGTRVLADSIFGHKGSFVLPLRVDLDRLSCLLNSRVGSFMARTLSQTLGFEVTHIQRIPLPEMLPDSLSYIGSVSAALKGLLVGADPLERSFFHLPLEEEPTQSLLQSLVLSYDKWEAIEALLHAFEGQNEEEVCRSYGLNHADVEVLLDETGIPVAWHPRVRGYDVDPEFNLQLESKEVDPVRHQPDGKVEVLNQREVEGLRARLRTLYRRGPRRSALTQTDEQMASNGAEREDAVSERTMLPTETFLEELSQELEIHPVSVYWLLKEMREQELLVCPAEVKRHFEDYASVSVIRMLGFRWPDQDPYERERGPILDRNMVDDDGIIPLVPCGDEPTAAQRTRQRLERDFGEQGADQSEREFRQWVGRSVEDWLKRDFFKHHIQHFKQRPIAWHFVSPERTFEAFVLYHRLSRETLQKLRAKYAGGLITRLRDEQERARKAGHAQKVSDIQFQIEDVEEFRTRLEKIERGDELTYRIRCRWKGEEENGRPGPYAPDIDDGVKVNIRPFQEAGLLAVKEVIKKW